MVDDAEIAEIFEHVGLGLREFGFAVGEAKFEGAEHEEEREYVNFVHVQLARDVSAVACTEKTREDDGTYALRILQIEYEHCPDLSIDFLKDEGKAIFCNVHRFAPGFNQPARSQQHLDPLTERDPFTFNVHAGAADHVSENAFPLPSGKLIEVYHRHSIFV